MQAWLQHVEPEVEPLYLNKVLCACRIQANMLVSYCIAPTYRSKRQPVQCRTNKNGGRPETCRTFRYRCIVHLPFHVLWLLKSGHESIRALMSIKSYCFLGGKGVEYTLNPERVKMNDAVKIKQSGQCRPPLLAYAAELRKGTADFLAYQAALEFAFDFTRLSIMAIKFLLYFSLNFFHFYHQFDLDLPGGCFPIIIRSMIHGCMDAWKRRTGFAGFEFFDWEQWLAIGGLKNSLSFRNVSCLKSLCIIQRAARTSFNLMRYSQ